MNCLGGYSSDCLIASQLYTIPDLTYLSLGTQDTPKRTDTLIALQQPRTCTSQGFVAFIPHPMGRNRVTEVNLLHQHKTMLLGLVHSIPNHGHHMPDYASFDNG
jgi:hypothetical protein